MGVGWGGGGGKDRDETDVGKSGNVQREKGHNEMPRRKRLGRWEKGHKSMQTKRK